MEELEESYKDEINLMDYVKVIWKNRILIAIIVVIVVITTAIASLIMTPVYESKAVIIPAGVLTRDVGSGLAAQLGIAPPASPISAEIVNILKSNTLKEKIIKHYNLLPILFNKNILSKEDENKLMWQGIRYLKGITKINFMLKDNIVEISVQFKDPKIAADIVSFTLSELNDHMSSETKRVAETNKKYLESQLDKIADPFIKGKIYALIAQQIETSMMAEVKENFAFKVLDFPRVPDMRIKPKRTRMVMVSFVVSLFLGIFTAFLKEYIDKFRIKQRESAEGAR
jgi:uncharacterized protein involved in exopolysaccharide biosynthesis